MFKFSSYQDTVKKHVENNSELIKLDNYKTKLHEKESDITQREEKLQEDKKQWNARITADKEALAVLANEKSTGFPWLAKAYADYFYLLNLKEADYLETKKHPAATSAEVVRTKSHALRILHQKFKIAQGLLDYYHNLFPFLEEYQDEVDDEILQRIMSKDINEPIEDDIEILQEDPVRIILKDISKAAYEQLSTRERNQRALDRFWNRNKSKWQIGRDYERYVGYLMEKESYRVFYTGILDGRDDLGRDLICKKNGKTIIIQCKYWSQHKTIRENHITQLFGTVMKYRFDNPDENVSTAFYTSTKLSDRAKEFGRAFGRHLEFDIRENFPFKLYPSIKCNISKSSREKIYHLPFDQQYDKTVIEPEKGECFVKSVKEAEDNGFRRAWKWIPVE